MCSGQIFHSKTKHFVPVHHAWQKEGRPEWRKTETEIGGSPSSFLLHFLSCGLTVVVSHLISCCKGPVEPLVARHKPHKHKDAHIVYTCTDDTVSYTFWLMYLVWLSDVDEQKTPLRGCSVMRGSLIINMLLYRVFHLTAGQKGRAIKFGSSEASTL